MPRGGKRPGAGRPKGGQNKKTAEAVEECEKTGQTPLQYLLGIMRDETASRNERMDAAKAAAPYVHARLQSSQVTAKVEAKADFSKLTDDELRALDAAMAKALAD